MIALDASALLCYLQAERGAERVADALASGAVICAAHWSEVAQKARAAGRRWPAARQALLTQGLSIEPVGVADAEEAARLWLERPSLSLADRLCLATADRLGCDTVLTTDRQWGEGPPVSQLR